VLALVLDRSIFVEKYFISRLNVRLVVRLFYLHNGRSTQTF
jgi:hypothetical protein